MKQYYILNNRKLVHCHEDICYDFRLLSVFFYDINQPALKTLRVLRPLKLVTGFQSKMFLFCTFYINNNNNKKNNKNNNRNDNKCNNNT